jgi:hypothetical protein
MSRVRIARETERIQTPELFSSLQPAPLFVVSSDITIHVGDTLNDVFLVPAMKPVSISDRGLELDLDSMVVGEFYLVEFQGDMLALRLSSENALETYEVTKVQ